MKRGGGGRVFRAQYSSRVGLLYFVFLYFWILSAGGRFTIDPTPPSLFCFGIVADETTRYAMTMTIQGLIKFKIGFVSFMPCVITCAVGFEGIFEDEGGVRVTPLPADARASWSCLYMPPIKPRPFIVSGAALYIHP